MGSISKNVFLKKYRFLQESFARASSLGVFFSDSSRHKMQPYLKAYFLEPRGVTPYFIVDVNASDCWVKLLRFMSTDHGEINAEAVLLNGNGAQDLKGVGYRYEHPERFVGAGADKHAFFHVQPIKQTRTGFDLPECPAWLPHSFPAFFMYASCAYELILYAIHSLSGWDRLQGYLTSTRDPNPVLARLTMTGDEARRSFAYPP